MLNMFISPIHLRVLATTLDLEGHASQAILSECGIEAIEEVDDAIWIPLGTYERLVQTVITHTRTPHFGLIAGTSLANQRYGVLPMLVMHMPSLRQGLQDIIRFAPLVITRPEISLHETDARAEIIITPMTEGGSASVFRVEFLVVALLQMLRYGSGNTIQITHIYFAHPRPAYEEKYHAYMGRDISFGAPSNSIIFQRQILDKPLPWHDRVSYIELKTKAELSLRTVHGHIDLVQRIKNELIDAFPNAPSMAWVAHKMGMSQRSLRRHLASCGTSHTELARACRQLMAELQLADTNASLKQIASDLGFSSVTSFHRAFKLWTGMTPQAWRSQRHVTNQEAAL